MKSINKTKWASLPPVSKSELLDSFERLCSKMGVTSRGFNSSKIQRSDEWAIIKRPSGWAIVCDAAEDRVPIGPEWCGFPTRRSMYTAMEIASSAVSISKWVK